MSLFRQTASGDLDFSSMGLVVVSDPGPETAQRLSNRFGLVEGEWEYDTRQGVPYFSRILSQSPANLPIVESLVRRIIQETPGVTEVVSVVATAEPDRVCHIEFEAKAQTAVIVGDTGGAFVVT